MSHPPTQSPVQSPVLTIDLTGQSVRCAFHVPSPEMDAFLAANNARSMVVIPLFREEKWAKWHRPGKRANPRRIERRVARRKKKIPDGWKEFGTLHTGQEGVPSVPAVIVFDRDRLSAKAVVESTGLEQLYWAGRSAGLAAYSTKMIDDSEFSDLSAVRRHAGKGLGDMLRALRNYSKLDTGLRMVGGGARQLRFLLASLVTVGAGACLLVAYGSGLEPFHPPGLVHPILIPFLIAGLYLRRLCVPRDPTDRREIAAAEVKEAWRGFAPHLLAVWIAVLIGVGLLTGAATMAEGSVSVTAWLEDFAVNATITLWILTPLVYSRRLSDAIGPILEVGITVFFSVVMLKITLYFIPQGFHFGFDFLSSILRLEIADWLVGWINNVVEIAAGLFFLTIMLGYGWVKAREQFVSWVPVFPVFPVSTTSTESTEPLDLPTMPVDQLESPPQRQQATRDSNPETGEVSQT